MAETTQNKKEVKMETKKEVGGFREEGEGKKGDEEFKSRILAE